MQALEQTTSEDFQLITKAHVLGLVQSAPFPRVMLKKARELYRTALRFGHALRRAEARFRADRAAGTFVPLPLQAQLFREELEKSWKKTSMDEWPYAQPNDGKAAVVAFASARPEDDEEAAQRSLREALKRLQRLGEKRPGLATYLGWLGRFDPEALSMLASPDPPVAAAMRLQCNAIWGEDAEDEEEEEEQELVAMAPSDLVEAVLLGAWLRDAGIAAEEAICRHQLPEENDNKDS